MGKPWSHGGGWLVPMGWLKANEKMGGFLCLAGKFHGSVGHFGHFPMFDWKKSWFQRHDGEMVMII